MSLSSRLSVFFLAALAVVLVGFSATLYLLGHSYLSHQLDDRLERALDVLEASVDVETGGLEWEPEDRRMTLGLEPGIEHVRWAVQDGAGRLVDRSANAQGQPFPPAGTLAETLPDRPGDATAIGSDSGWRLARRHLRLQELLRLGRGHPEDDAPDDDVEYTDLVLTVGLSPTPVESSLSWLGMALTVVATALWLVCAALGHWLCRRALAPVTRMSRAAREMTADGGQGRLPSPGTGDELEDLGKAFNDLLGRWHGTLERQQRFTGDASHQLRTPLAGLLNLVEVIRRRPRSAEEYEQTLDQVHREANRLKQIVESLLFLARTEAEAGRLAGEPVELSTWVPVQLQRWNEHPRASDLRDALLDAPLWLRAHPSLLSQCLENLVENALKYSAPGTPVTVNGRREAGRVSLIVEDRGVGMTAEEVASAFEPFYRSPMARQLGRSGVGLGLSVVKRIVTAHDGTIEIESKPGSGTRVVLRLPELESRPVPASFEPARSC